MEMRREDYKAVKHMDKAKMGAYLENIYRRGYEAGVKAVSEQMKSKASAAAAVSEG